MRLAPTWRQPAGIALILVWIAAWSIAVASAAPLIGAAPRLAHALYYAAAGILWIAPLKPLIRWMNSDRSRK